MPTNAAGIMHEFKHHQLHSGKGGPIVKNRDQAVAIAMSEERRNAPREHPSIAALRRAVQGRR